MKYINIINNHETILNDELYYKTHTLLKQPHMLVIVTFCQFNPYYWGGKKEKKTSITASSTRITKH